LKSLHLYICPLKNIWSITYALLKSYSKSECDCHLFSAINGMLVWVQNALIGLKIIGKDDSMHHYWQVVVTE